MSPYGPEVQPPHADLLAASAIAPEVAQARGYRSMPNTKEAKHELHSLGFGRSQCRVPALLIPVHSVTGTGAVTYQLRPYRPREKDGKKLKYETPAGTRMVLDVPPPARASLGDPRQPLLVTEGARKADAAVSHGACCVALLGVWNFRGTNEHGGKVALADWESVALNERPVYIVFDSDVMQKSQVQEALIRLKRFLESRSAHVRVINLPPGPNGQKTGLDDFFARGGSLAALFNLASATLQEAPAAMYERTEQGLIWRKVGPEGVVRVPLTNFDARIVADVVEDDDAETRRVYELEVHLGDRCQRVSVPAVEFPAMNWPGEYLGAGAIVYAGLGRRDHARVAVQQLSGRIPERRVYTHVGWRQLDDGQWVFLHAGGAIGEAGAAGGVEVALPQALGRYRLPSPPTEAELVAAVRASLRLLDVAPARLTMPLFAAIWRAALGGTDFSLHLTGDTGAGKTALLALAVQHFGAEWETRVLPGWSSTENALEALAFQAKDVLLPVDDFAPSADPHEARRLQRTAERLFRAQGNVTGRMRMRADTTLRPPRPVRGLIVSTGEDVPQGQSLRARVLIIHVEKGTHDKPGDVDWRELTRCQEDAARGLYAMTLAGFVQRLAPRYDEVRQGLRARLHERRAEAVPHVAHRRTSGIIADLGLGLEEFLAFARELGGVPEAVVASCAQQAKDAFEAIVGAQQEEHLAVDPVRRFLELLWAAIAGGRAHLASATGNQPDKTPERYGWREHSVGPLRKEWWPEGERIGWVGDEGLFLDEDLAYAAAQRLARDQGAALTIGTRTLSRRLKERGLLLATDQGRNTVRRTLEGKERRVLWLQPSTPLIPEKPAEVDEPDGAQ